MSKNKHLLEAHYASEASVSDASANTAADGTVSATPEPDNDPTVAATPRPKKRAKTAAGSWEIMPGRRVIKGYPMTEDGLQMLTVFDGAAGLLLSLATTSGTIWFDISKDLALSTAGSPPGAVGFYDGVRTVCGWAAIVFVMLTVALLVLRGNYLSKIKTQTHFDT